jgi:ABC-type phosphate transport system substrate-binding protein
MSAAAVAVGAMTLLSGAPPAHAVLPSGQVAVTAGGSDTTENMMNSMMTSLDNTTLTVNSASTTVRTYNVLTKASNFVSQGYGTNDCPSDTTWNKDPLAPAANNPPTQGIAPFGSGAGRDYLAAENGGSGPERGATDGTTSSGSPNLSSPTINFTAGDVGKVVTSAGVFPAGTTISTFTDNQHVSLSANAASSKAGNLSFALSSTAGQNFGCISVARSSSGPRGGGGGDRSTFQYFAYALDAVTWGTTSPKAPATLTRQQITDVYDCNVTDWSQVGGSSGAIQRYFPQPGSGTRSFFISDVLVGKGGSYTPPTHAQNANCPTDAILIEENQANGQGAVNNSLAVQTADFDKAILPYSGAVWASQAFNSLNPTLDRRDPLGNGTVKVRLGGITTSSGTPIKDNIVTWSDADKQYELNPAVVAESNVKIAVTGGGGTWCDGVGCTASGAGNFPGIRFVFNVLDNNGNRAGYQAAIQMLGFVNTSGGAKSPLCDGTNSTTPTGFHTSGKGLKGKIQSAEFLPLDTSATVNANSNQAGSTCRFYQGVN